jgi:hypothetical protein
VDQAVRVPASKHETLSSKPSDIKKPINLNGQAPMVPIILATLEAEIWKIVVPGQTRQKKIL